eukprot:403342807
MGASGAGKTTLLNILSQRTKCLQSGKIGGKVTVNDSTDLTMDLFGKFGAYVMQDDILYQYFTPREAITFAARMKLDLKREEQDSRVNELIQELGLKSCADTIIGNIVNKTISGGEKKRTSIGIEIITNPSLIILDEPTSGLDSYKSLLMIKLLNKLARQGKTVISSIHSPSSESFLLFDKLILLSEGHIIFQGQAKLAHEYFSSIGFQCPNYKNPADYYMKEFASSSNVESQQKQDFLLEKYNQRVSQQVAIECDEIKLLNPDLNHEIYHAKFKTQIISLMNREFIQLKRNQRHFRARAIQNIYTALIVVLIFHNLSSVEIDHGVNMSLIGAIYFICQNTVLQNLLASVMMLYQDRRVFLKEAAQNTYDLFPYYLAKLLIELPFLLFQSFTTTLIVYFAIGLSLNFTDFIAFFFSLSCLIYCAASYGQIIGCIFTRPETASQVAPQLIVPLNIVGGFYTNVKLLPIYIKWLQYLSPIRYGLESILQIQFKDAQNSDSADEYDSDILLFMDYKLGYGTCIGALICLIVGFRILSYYALKLFIKRNI